MSLQTFPYNNIKSVGFVMYLLNYSTPKFIVVFEWGLK